MKQLWWSPEDEHSVDCYVPDQYLKNWTGEDEK